MTYAVSQLEQTLRARRFAITTELTPPVSLGWVERIEKVGGTPAGEAVRAQVAATPESEQRIVGWRIAKAVAAEAREAGFAGIVIMGLRFSTAVDEAYEIWQDERISPLFPGGDQAPGEG